MLKIPSMQRTHALLDVFWLAENILVLTVNLLAVTTDKQVFNCDASNCHLVWVISLHLPSLDGAL